MTGKPRRQSGSEMHRTTVMLPEPTADLIKREARETQVSAATVILNAYFTQHEALANLYDTPFNKERVRLGLEPEINISLYNPDDDTEPLSLYLRYDANRRLTRAASQMGLSRRRYIAELVNLNLKHQKGD